MKRTLFPLFLAAAFAIAAPASASDTYLDCSAPTSGDGTEAQPLNSLGGGFELSPGDRLLLRRGTTCAGKLQVTGGGTSVQPAGVGAYGSGDLPKVIGSGQDAVRVEDVPYLTVRDLDISNPGGGGPLGEGSSVRNGVRVTAGDATVTGLTLTGLKIHDVDGDLTKSGEGSAAIQVTVTGPPPVCFQDLTIEDNEIDSVSRSAISISGTNDPDRPDADQPWPEASSGVVIRGNRIDRIAGDGIVPRGTDGAIVEDNLVSNGNLAGRPLTDPAGPMCNAGIWAFRANNTLIRGNEVFGFRHNGCDGTGFDVDYRQDGTVIEGNYSHDNGGGFVLLCTDTSVHHADVRFNLSVDDGTMINHGPCGIADGILGDLSGIRMFNNTVVGNSPTVSIQLSTSEEMFQPGNFLFANNLVLARQPIEKIPCGGNCTSNAFFGLPPNGTDALTKDPLLTSNFRLSDESPLRGAGVAIPHGAVSDYFGNPVPKVPSIGFDQAPPKPATGPGKSCLKARLARNEALRKVKVLNRKVKKLRRGNAKKSKLRLASRQLRKAKMKLNYRSKMVRQQCRAGATSG